MQVMTEISRVLPCRVADVLDAGPTPNTETAIATENDNTCADMVIQIMGGAGLMAEHQLQVYGRDARVGTIGGGTSEIMRPVIAKHMNLA